MKEANTDNRTFCRACAGPLLPVIDLGMQPPSNAFLKSPTSRGLSYPLRAVVCQNCWLMQLSYDVSPFELFDDYVYFSSGSREWLGHTKSYCDMIYQRLNLNKDSFVVEIGSNDGHLLKNLKDRCKVLGIDPSSSVAAVANAQGVPTRVAHFNAETELSDYADLVIANNVMGHVPELNWFIYALARVLSGRGTITVEFPHVFNLLRGDQFDTIYHEHYSYLSLLALEPLLAKYRLSVYDVEELPTHGGSLRLYIGKGQHRVSDSVLDMRVKETGLRYFETYQGFAHRTKGCVTRFLRFLREHTVVGYGAAAKGNTFLNCCGLTQKDIAYVADTTSAKIGKYLPGSMIPVVSEEALIAQQPPYVLILPWNWEHEIVGRLGPIIKKWDGRFVVAVPELRVITP